MDEPLLKLDQISQVYTSGLKSFYALREINLTIKEGEFVAFVGPAGCGKSTLLRIITGLQLATSGKVLYCGSPLNGINSDATIVFQTFALFPWLSVQENVEVALKSLGLPANLRATRAVKFLDMVGLDGFETAYPRELSRGMKQKVGVARAMALEPVLLCLDEPFSALDVLSARALQSELLELWSSKKLPTKAILFVTHNIEEAVSMVDRIIIMEKQPGHFVADIKVDIPHPRNPKSAEFLTLVDRVYATLAGQTQPEHLEMGSAPGEPGGRLRPLLDIPISSLFGLLEHLDFSPNNRADIYKVAEELKVESDQLLRFTEVAELLGFATIAQGDIALTPLGETFAEASITSRKEIFSTRIKRLPIFKWLISMLKDSEKGSMQWNMVQEALEREFPPSEAEKQLKIAVNWGRYAELLVYDDNQEVIYLESGVVIT